MAPIELEDYLVLENASRHKHEYLALHGKLQGSPCEALSIEMRLRIEAVDAVFYPDVLGRGVRGGGVALTVGCRRAGAALSCVVVDIAIAIFMTMNDNAAREIVR